jgi:hypothetical protein
MAKHPELSLRCGETTSPQRAVGFNKPQINRLFNKLSEMIENHSFLPSRIFKAGVLGSLKYSKSIFSERETAGVMKEGGKSL